jgi:hypothetical protein
MLVGEGLIVSGLLVFLGARLFTAVKASGTFDLRTAFSYAFGVFHRGRNAYDFWLADHPGLVAVQFLGILLIAVGGFFLAFVIPKLY